MAFVSRPCCLRLKELWALCFEKDLCKGKDACMPVNCHQSTLVLELVLVLAVHGCRLAGRQSRPWTCTRRGRTCLPRGHTTEGSLCGTPDRTRSRSRAQQRPATWKRARSARLVFRRMWHGSAKVVCRLVLVHLVACRLNCWQCSRPCSTPLGGNTGSLGVLPSVGGRTGITCVLLVARRSSSTSTLRKSRRRARSPLWCSAGWTASSAGWAGRCAASG